MEEVWERAVEAALEGQADAATAPRTLTLDGAVKCLHGRLPPPSLLEKFQSLEHLSIANVGASSLEKFPRLRNLQRLILSDNRIAGGLEFLVEAGLESLRDLDLSNNRIQFLEDLAPLARLRLVSLDLYECPVTRVKDYRSRVFGMIRSLKYLDKLDADENERPETEDEEEDDEDEEEEEEDDPGSGEVDGEDRTANVMNGGGGDAERGGVVEVDEDEESDADEEEAETGRRLEANGSSSHHLSNGFRVATTRSGHGEDEESEELEEEEYVEDFEEEGDLGEEVNEEEGGDDVMDVHEIDNSEEEDGVEDDDEDEEYDEEDEDDEEYVEDDDVGEPGSTGRLTSTEGEIDGHEQGEEDENGGVGEDDEVGVGDDHEYEDDDDDGEDEEDETDYLVQPIGQNENLGRENVLGAAANEEEGTEEEVDYEEDHSLGGVTLGPSSSRPSSSKRRRDDEDDLDDDSIEDSRSLKRQ